LNEFVFIKITIYKYYLDSVFSLGDTNMSNGLLITFEGGECAGKGTQIKKLYAALSKDFNVLSNLWEMGSTDKAELIRLILKNKLDSNYEFPQHFINGDFILNNKSYDGEFVPPVAKSFLLSALDKIDLLPLKKEFASFILYDELSDDSKLKEVIKNIGDDNKLEVLAREYFSKEKLSPEAQADFLFAARNFLYYNVIKPNLYNYDFILLDRSKDSTVVYQGHAQNPDLVDSIREKNLDATINIVPDLTFYLDLDVDLAFERLSKRNPEKYKDFFESMDSGFHNKVRQGYLEEVEHYFNLPMNHPEYERIKVIDASKSVDQVHEDIYRIVKEKVESLIID
jgi:dTMP kinase